jgi:uncharacterized protein
MYFINVIDTYRYVVAICDKELLGKKFEDDKFQLDVKESFYKGKDGKEASEAEVLERIRKLVMEDATFNIVGKNSVRLALKLGLITEEGIKEINGVPFSLVLI